MSLNNQFEQYNQARNSVWNALGMDTSTPETKEVEFVLKPGVLMSDFAAEIKDEFDHEYSLDHNEIRTFAEKVWAERSLNARILDALQDGLRKPNKLGLNRGASINERRVVANIVCELYREHKRRDLGALPYLAEGGVDTLNHWIEAIRILREKGTMITQQVFNKMPDSEIVKVLSISAVAEADMYLLG